MADIALTDVVVATVLPFDETGAIDWDGYRRLLAYCATPDGVSAVFVNGHAGEGAALKLTSSDVAELHPERVARMLAALRAWERDVSR